MPWPFQNKPLTHYWIKVFGLYVLTEGCIQSLFNFILNNFRQSPISNIEFHGVMWLFQCLLIWPIWWVANAVYKKTILTQVIVNLCFFILYSYIWFDVVQDIIRGLHQYIQVYTRAPEDRLPTPVDTTTYLNYQIFKHAFRLSWFFLANYFYHYRDEEKKRRDLAITNKELELKLLTWHLNPDFYFQAIGHLQHLAAKKPSSCTGPILQLAGVMEYVIYEAKEKVIPMASELFFLHNYIDLANQQSGNEQRLTLSSTGTYDKLTIAPLLIVGFIDKIVTEDKMGKSYLFQVELSERRLLFSAINRSTRPALLSIQEDDLLYRTIRGKYEGRFILKLNDGEKILELNLLLDEGK